MLELDKLNLFCLKYEYVLESYQSRLLVEIDLSVKLHQQMTVANILKHFRNTPLHILLFLPHGFVEDIFLVIFHVRVQ